MKITFGLLVLLLCHLNSFAGDREGGWSGGGGEVIGDQHNPWFLENTTLVTYCVDVDQASISASATTLPAMIEKVIQQWNGILTPFNNRKNVVKLATQRWLRLSCSSDVDVRFQFGWGTLTQKQQQFLGSSSDPHRYIAIAVRTDYDLVHLKGKGFVYVASDIGPHAFQKEATQVDRPWRFPTLLFAELTHELGHIFGLPHLNSELLASTNRGVMSEYFPELILQQWIWQGIESTLYQPSEMKAFFYSTRFKDCSPVQDALSWFHAPSDTKCLGFDIRNLMEGPSSIVVRATDKGGKVLKDLGTINFGSIGSEHFNSDITVYLNSSQTILPAPQSNGLPYAFGPGTRSSESSGQFVSVSNELKPVFIVLKENELGIIVHQIIDDKNETLIPIVMTNDTDD